MKSTKHLKIVSLGIIILIAACKKGNNNDKPTPPVSGTYSSIDAAYAEVAPKSKKVTLNATDGGTFYGNSGTRYSFPANAFQNVTGTIVAGNIDLEVLECLTESDMIFGKLLTVSNGNPLISAGEVSVKASQSGKPIIIRPGISYEIHLPAKKSSATAGMQYFSGAASTSVPGSTVTWNLRGFDTGSSRVIYNGDTIAMYPDSVGFINADKYPSVGTAMVDVKIEGIDASIKAKDFFAYCLLESALSAVPIYSTKTAFTDNTFKSARILRLNAHYVVCAIYGGEFYGGILENTTANDGVSYTVTISKISPLAFKAKIDALK